MTKLRVLLKDPTWVAHAVGLITITANEATRGNPLFSAIVGALTGIFHVCQTFGNGTAVPAGYKTSPVSDMTPKGAGFGAPRVDGPAPEIPLTNAAGTTILEP